MSSFRRPSFWPIKLSNSSIKKSYQIQYFSPDQQAEEGHIYVHAINILDTKSSPYHWSSIPFEFLEMFKILSWIQWSFAHSYVSKKIGGQLIGRYILYMERILDELWDAIDDDKFEEWSEFYGSRWAKTQRGMKGHHSDVYVEMCLESEEGSEGKLYLGVEVEDWEREGKSIIDEGFPGRDLFLEKGWFYKLTEEEKNEVVVKVKDMLEEEERGEF